MLHPRHYGRMTRVPTFTLGPRRSGAGGVLPQALPIDRGTSSAKRTLLPNHLIPMQGGHQKWDDLLSSFEINPRTRTSRRMYDSTRRVLSLHVADTPRRPDKACHLIAFNVIRRSPSCFVVVITGPIHELVKSSQFMLERRSMVATRHNAHCCHLPELPPKSRLKE